MARTQVYATTTPGYTRRLRTILNDPEYGPKLVRLSAADQQRVLARVNQREGREARRLINELDEARRARARTSARARRYAALPEPERTGSGRPDEQRDFWAAYDRAVKAP